MNPNLLRKATALLLALLPMLLFGQGGSTATCSITGNSAVCSDGTTQLCAPADCAFYWWSTGEMSQCITVSNSGTYSVTVVNQNGERTECSKNVTAAARPDCAISREGSICADGAIELCASSGYAGYQWSTGETTRCIEVTHNGTFRVTITNSSGCASVCSRIINETAAPDCSIIGDNLECNGGSTQICAAAGFAAYRWSNGQTSRCITIDEPGTYRITVTNNNGCQTTCSRTITRPFPSCEITGNNLSCADGTTQLCANSGNAAYRWSTGQTSRCITVSEPGNYRVTVTSNDGCSNVCRKTVTVNPPPTCAIIGDPLDCSGNPARLCVSTGYNSYKWSTGATTACINITLPGTYRVTATDANGCSAIDTIVIGQPTAPTCAIQVSGNTAKVIVTGGRAPYTYRWNTGTTTNESNNAPNGIYSVTVTDANGCTTTCATDLCANLTYAGKIGHHQYLCGPGADAAPIVELSGATGGSGTIEYQWMKSTVGGPFNNIHWEPIEGATSKDYDPGTVYETTYFVRCTRRAYCPFIETNIIKIEVGNQVVAKIEAPALICANMPTTFHTPTIGAPANFTWDFGPAASPRYAQGASPRVSFSSFGIFTISLTVAQENCVVTIYKRINVSTLCSDLPTNDNNTINPAIEPTELPTSAIISLDAQNIASPGYQYEQLRVYPNPVTNQLIIEFAEPLNDDVNLQIINTNGTVLRTLSPPTDVQRQEIDFTNLPAGTYFIKIRDSNTDVKVLKVLKQ
ncbi:MAG: T9SS type A sorting domain-containing protein [Saprospiraceae bacterium]